MCKKKVTALPGCEQISFQILFWFSSHLLAKELRNSTTQRQFFQFPLGHDMHWYKPGLKLYNVNTR